MKVNYSGKIIGLLANATAWIVGPVLVGTLIGKWLDQKFNTKPWLFLMAIGVCFIVSMFGLVINATKEFKKIDEESKKDDQVAQE